MPLFILPDHSKASICVIGNMMLNYIDGLCVRISSSASVQAVNVDTILNSNS